MTNTCPACFTVSTGHDVLPHHLLGDAAKQQVLHRAAPVRSHHGLLCAWLNAVFAQHHKPEIAR